MVAKDPVDARKLFDVQIASVFDLLMKALKPIVNANPEYDLTMSLTEVKLASSEYMYSFTRDDEFMVLRVYVPFSGVH